MNQEKQMNQEKPKNPQNPQGQTPEKEGDKKCPKCGHVHNKPDGSCDCGCRG